MLFLLIASTLALVVFILTNFYAHRYFNLDTVSFLSLVIGFLWVVWTSHSYRDVLTPAERNRFRWLIGGLVLLIGTTIAFGFVMHNPADPNPARLVSMNGTADTTEENRNKGWLTGVTIRLRAFPGFAFYVSRRQYDVRLETLASALTPNRPVTLLIRASDLRKKLRKTEPLTFGDKYDDYDQIMVFGVNQGNSVDILTPGPVYEPTHTNPLLRTFLLSILLLFCWTGWVYVDRQPVLQAG